MDYATLLSTVAPDRILKWGALFFWSCPSTFLALKYN